MTGYKRLAQLRTAEQFMAYCAEQGATLPFDLQLKVGTDAPLNQPYVYRNQTILNRFAIAPMEGWDGTADGFPSEHTRRRWQHFGQSGAKLIWGGEATAVRHDGRANAHQLVINPHTVGEIAQLRQLLIEAHREQVGSVDGLYIGLQLTHSGRFCRPNTKELEPQVAYRHPLLDPMFHVNDEKQVLTDEQIDELIDDFTKAAVLAQEAGFDFVDLKHCHGYLGHEFLSAYDRPGKYGGSFENRTRFLRNLVSAIRQAAPELDLGVRLSAIDFIPFKPNADNIGEAQTYSGYYPYSFGGDGTGIGYDLSEPKQFLDLLTELQIGMVCITAGSPYYVPHLTRPAAFPPSDGYLPPEDPLIGVARQIEVTRQLKQYKPDLLVVGSGYSYLQDWLPNVAQAVIANQMADFIALGRMVLSYPQFAYDVLNGNPLQRKSICRTFSDCTTAPRNGIISGCYPLDDFYKQSPEYDQVMGIKKAMKATE